MPALERKSLRDQIRREIRDEASTAYVFTDTELNIKLSNALRAYSKHVPREVKAVLSLVANQVDYAAPEDLRAVIDIRAGDTEFAVTEIFGGLMTLSPVPAQGGPATFKYTTGHTLPTADTGNGSVSTYDPIDEPLIAKHVIAQCWETLAGDGAKYYDYQEGDIRENRGKTQEQFRKEADRLYGEFDTAAEESAEARQALKPIPARTMATKVSRAKPTPSRTIYRS